MNKITELAKKMGTVLEEISREFLVEFKEQLSKLFEKYPQVEYFSTPAYTNYFNDGDPCYYSVREYLSKMYPSPKNPETDEYYEDTYYDDSPDVEAFLPLKEYVELISLVPNSVLEEVYEEGEICFYRDGKSEVVDYNHD
jgi:hypothetical protein